MDDIIRHGGYNAPDGGYNTFTISKDPSGIGITDWSKYVGQDERYMRPSEVDLLRGDSSKALKNLGWKPKTSLEEMVGKMIDNDIKQLGEK